MRVRHFHQALFRIRERWKALITAPVRRCFWTLQGMRVGRGTDLPRLAVTWPHQVAIGAGCVLEPDISFKFDGIWREGPAIVIGDETYVGRSCEFNIQKSFRTGRHCLIASGCKFIDHDHGIERGRPMNEQAGEEAAIILGDDVWLGANAVVLKGVTIGEGSIVGAGAVVTKSIPAFEIWAGIPARRIGERAPLKDAGMQTSALVS